MYRFLQSFRLILSSSVLLLFCLFINAQSIQERIHTHLELGGEPCSSWDKAEKLFELDPNLMPENNKAYQELERFTKEFQENYNPNFKNEDLVIPVVVHVVHNNGPENLPDDIIYDAINDLNTCFKGENINVSSIRPEFESRLGSVNVRFEMAKFDPLGNPSNGIERIVSDYTYAGDNKEMKQQIGWPRDKYLNIWLVNKAIEADNTSGFAYTPPNVDAPQYAYLDGIVICYWAFGNHAQTYDGFEYVLAHEVGHWSNLEHIWGTGAYGKKSSCRRDDGVEDTPQTSGNLVYDAAVCGTDITTCKSTDNTSNFMDYAVPCYAMFTTGQASRMMAAYNSSASQRNNLWSPENLQLTLGIDAGITEGETETGNPPDTPTETPTDSLATCIDGIQNGNETGIDCGGDCPSCETMMRMCSAPTQLRSTPSQGGKRAILSWDAVESADYYTVRNRASDSNNWKYLVPNSNTVTITGLKKSRMYSWEVKAVCGTEESEWATADYIAGQESVGTPRLLVQNIEEQFLTYPNPFGEFLGLAGNLPEAKTRRVAIRIYDFTGKEILYKSVFTDETGFYETQIDVSELIYGQYVVSVRTGDYHRAEKIIKLQH